MSKTMAKSVLSALKSTAVLVTTMAEADKVYLYRANDYDMLAVIYKGYDDLFEQEYFEVIPSWNHGGFRRIAFNADELKSECEKLNGYPTDADNHRNYSRSVYKETSY